MTAALRVSGGDGVRVYRVRLAEHRRGRAVVGDHAKRVAATRRKAAEHAFIR